MKVIKPGRVPIKLWLDDLDDAALEQAMHLADLPFAFRHVAIMPDSHVGFGMPIGGVFASEEVIIPNAVGVDIGCGMCAVKTSLQHLDKPLLKNILTRIHQQIPVGFKHHQSAQDTLLMPAKAEDIADTEVISKEYFNACFQIGTLGGGNHFIEIQQGADGYIWVMIHSGSRNLGLQVAQHYNAIAVQRNKKWHSTVPKEWKLSFLPVDSNEGKAYLREMQFCVDFAYANRKRMMQVVLQNCMAEELDRTGITFTYEPEINIAHNYAAEESHFGRMVWVHRKGATKADTTTIGIIPGSQGSSSYIVQGKGNPESFNSCSHGAGRKLGRTQAQNHLNLAEEVKKLEEKGILHAVRGKSSLDEAPGAYKDIDVVMENQKDLVEILVKLSPLAVVKG